MSMFPLYDAIYECFLSEQSLVTRRTNLRVSHQLPSNPLRHWHISPRIQVPPFTHGLLLLQYTTAKKTKTLCICTVTQSLSRVCQVVQSIRSVLEIVVSCVSPPRLPQSLPLPLQNTTQIPLNGIRVYYGQRYLSDLYNYHY